MFWPGLVNVIGEYLRAHISYLVDTVDRSSFILITEVSSTILFGNLLTTANSVTHENLDTQTFVGLQSESLDNHMLMLQT